MGGQGGAGRVERVEGLGSDSVEGVGGQGEADRSSGVVRGLLFGFSRGGSAFAIASSFS